jgi:hypothetical protein
MSANKIINATITGAASGVRGPHEANRRFVANALRIAYWREDEDSKEFLERVLGVVSLEERNAVWSRLNTVVGCSCAIHQKVNYGNAVGVGCERLSYGGHSAIRALYEAGDYQCAIVPGVGALDVKLAKYVEYDIGFFPDLRKKFATGVGTWAGDLGAFYCYLRLFSSDIAMRVARILGPAPVKARLIRYVALLGRDEYDGVRLEELPGGQVHVEGDGGEVKTRKQMLEWLGSLGSNEARVGATACQFKLAKAGMGFEDVPEMIGTTFEQVLGAEELRDLCKEVSGRRHGFEVEERYELGRHVAEEMRASVGSECHETRGGVAFPGDPGWGLSESWDMGMMKEVFSVETWADSDFERSVWLREMVNYKSGAWACLTYPQLLGMAGMSVGRSEWLETRWFEIAGHLRQFEAVGFVGARALDVDVEVVYTTVMTAVVLMQKVGFPDLVERELCAPTLRLEARLAELELMVKVWKEIDDRDKFVGDARLWHCVKAMSIRDNIVDAIDGWVSELGNTCLCASYAFANLGYGDLWHSCDSSLMSAWSR